jgi:hypothetical protein
MSQMDPGGYPPASRAADSPAGLSESLGGKEKAPPEGLGGRACQSVGTYMGDSTQN